jgi:hypothetical protein
MTNEKLKVMRCFVFCVGCTGDEAVEPKFLCLPDILMKVLKAVGYYKLEMCFRRMCNSLTREKSHYSVL